MSPMLWEARTLEGFEPEEGQCYFNVLRVVTDFPEYYGWYVIHGWAIGQGDIAGKRHGHAWLESNDRRWVFDPSYGVAGLAALYYHIGRINRNEIVSYTRNAAQMSVGKSGHYGPWHIMFNV